MEGLLITFGDLSGVGEREMFYILGNLIPISSPDIDLQETLHLLTAQSGSTLILCPCTVCKEHLTLSHFSLNILIFLI